MSYTLSKQVAEALGWHRKPVPASEFESNKFHDGEPIWVGPDGQEGRCPLFTSQSQHLAVELIEGHLRGWTFWHDGYKWHVRDEARRSEGNPYQAVAGEDFAECVCLALLASKGIEVKE